jgi:mRNA interferase MazF
MCFVGGYEMEKYNKYEHLFKWSALKLWIQQKYERKNLADWFVPRGSIYGCYLGENIGYEKSGIDSRPVLVISNDAINRRSGNVVIIPLSKNIKWNRNLLPKKVLSQNSHYVLFKSKYTKLNYDSAVQCEDIKVVSKSRLGGFICFVEPEDMKSIRKKIKYTLQI